MSPVLVDLSNVAISNHSPNQLLEAALRANGIQIREGTVQLLLDQQEWIYPSERVEKMLQKLNKDQLYTVFNSEHHIQSVPSYFIVWSLSKRKFVSCTVTGLRGNPSFYSILPFKGETKKMDIHRKTFCGHLWKKSFEIKGNVENCLEQFYKDASLISFEYFMLSLREYTRSAEGTRVWVLLDEVALFENFPITLPNHRNLGPFHWIITGSAGIGTWVSNRYLEEYVFDLPLFSKEQCLHFANQLGLYLGLDRNHWMDEVPEAGFDDFLEERFGGVIGYITELLLELSNRNSVSQYLTKLSDRISNIIRHSTRGTLSAEQLAKDWLNENKSTRNNWSCFRDAGLCGTQPPRGVVFSLILEWLHTFYTAEALLPLVQQFRSTFQTDPGIDGSLLEFEEILKLKANQSFSASPVKVQKQEWVIQNSVELPPRNSEHMSILQYLKDQSIHVVSSQQSQWSLILLPTGFEVIDVVLVHSSRSPIIYGIQITRSKRPFQKHHTFDTCPPKSKEKLKQLWNAISKHFNERNDTEMFHDAKKLFVMLAPNSEEDGYKQPNKDSSEYYFSPVIPNGSFVQITEKEPTRSKRKR